MGTVPAEASIPLLRARLQHVGLSYYQLWVRCDAFGSTLNLFEFEAVMEQALRADAVTHACIAHALFEVEQGWD